MFNDLSTPLSYLRSRRSGRVRDMVGPGPSEAELEAMIGIAARTPDHGKLAPWRFVVVPEARRDAFAALLRQALDDNDPGATEAHRAKADEFARGGQGLVVLLSAPVAGHKVPVWEQSLSAGAAAMNFLHAAHAMGFVASWLTGWAAYDPTVRAAFAKVPGEQIAGFLFVGSPGRPLEERPRPDLGAVARRWDGVL